MEQGELAGMGMADGFELFDAFEFAVEGAFIREGGAVNNLDGSERAGSEIASQPNLAVSPSADASEQFKIGNVGWSDVVG
jgi:hypothetical protein